MAPVYFVIAMLVSLLIAVACFSRAVFLGFQPERDVHRQVAVCVVLFIVAALCALGCVVGLAWNWGGAGW